MSSKNTLDAFVIGGGPGGLVAALYLARYQRNLAMVQHGIPRASWIPRTHNYPGYEKGIPGAELLRHLKKQVRQHQVPIYSGVAQVEKCGSLFEVNIGSDSFKAKNVIFATGIEDEQPVIANVPELRTKGYLRYCPICDAFEYRNRTLAVLAQSESGIRSALFLSSYSKRLIVITPPTMQVTPSLTRKLKARGVIVLPCNLEQIEEDPVKKGVWLHCEDAAPLFAHAVYVLLGAQVHDEAFRNIRGIQRDPSGYLVANPSQELTVPGLYGVGDCVSSLSQLTVAMGQAAVAATKIHKRLLDAEL